MIHRPSQQPLIRLVGSSTLLLAVLGASPAIGARIEYAAIDVADTTANEDRWQYEYVVRDFDFAPSQGFTIYFDVDSTRALEIPPQTIHPDWDVIAVQPDGDLPDDGFFDALVVGPTASLDVVFRVSFVWLGGPAARPGAQRFEINQFDPQGDFAGTLETGFTVIPEPGGALLTGLGLLALAGNPTRSDPTAPHRRARRASLRGVDPSPATRECER